jgi:hypothetical protein
MLVESLWSGLPDRLKRLVCSFPVAIALDIAYLQISPVFRAFNLTSGREARLDALS